MRPDGFKLQGLGWYATDVPLPAPMLTDQVATLEEGLIAVDAAQVANRPVCGIEGCTWPVETCGLAKIAARVRRAKGIEDWASEVPGECDQAILVGCPAAITAEHITREMEADGDSFLAG